MAGLSSIVKNLPGPGEIEAILDLLPQAALLVDAESNRIVLSNKKATKLSAYNRQEFQGLPLTTLLPNAEKLSKYIVTDNKDKWETVLIQRSGVQTVVKGKVFRLNPDNQWYLVILAQDSESSQAEIEQELEQQRIDALSLLTQAITDSDIDSAYKQILQAGQVLSGANTLAIYLPDDGKEQLMLYLYWGNASMLPKLLPFIDVDHLRVSYIWKPGTRVLSELHSMALANNNAYMATSPLEEDNPQKGLLLIGGQIDLPDNKLLEHLVVLSSVISASSKYNASIKILEQQLQNKEFQQNSNESIQDTISDGLIFTTPDFLITGMNAIAESTLGYSSKEVQSQEIHNILISPNSLKGLLTEAATMRGVQDLGHIKLHRRDGQLLLAHIRLVPLYENEKLRSIVILISDLSQYEEYKAKNKQLEQQALLGEVTAIFAHEVRNPINNISTGLQLMAMKFPEDDPIQNQIRNLKQDCDRLADLMKSVLSFSKSREYRMESIDLQEYLTGILARWQPRLARYHIEHRLQVVKDTPPVMGDRRALEQVFTNLISNSIEAMKNQEEGTLALKAKLITITGLPDVVQIDISDTGPGIPQNIQHRIFDPFFTTNNNGTGLGLAITKRIVSAHNGQISVNSFPGGTVFQLTLPVADL